jgi:hypothetical protein
VPDYLRVATFEADQAAIDAMVSEIGSAEGPPPGIPAKRITVLKDRAADRVTMVVRFGSEADLETGSATLESMSPPTDAARRVSVDTFEVLLEREAP